MFPLVCFSWEQSETLGPRVASQMLRHIFFPSTCQHKEALSGCKTHYKHLRESVTGMIRGGFIGAAFVCEVSLLFAVDRTVLRPEDPEGNTRVGVVNERMSQDEVVSSYLAVNSALIVVFLPN